MTKKAFSKVVAAVLVTALCLAAVFTGAVSASETVTCQLSGWSYAPGATDEYVTFELTFSSAAAFTAGSFTVSHSDDLDFVACSYAQSATGDIPQVYINTDNKKVLFAAFTESSTDDMKEFGSLTLLLKFVPTTSIRESDAGKQWTASVSDVSVTNKAEATYVLGTSVTTATAHVHNFTVDVSDTTNKCEHCDAVETTVPTDIAEGGNSLASTRKANITFAKDGDVVLNALLPKSAADAVTGQIYFVYSYSNGVDEEAVEVTVAKPESAETLSDGDFYVFPCGKNAGIGRMARDIVGHFVVVNGNNVTKSAKWNYSVKECLEGLMNNSDTNVVNYSKALWNYGKYTTEKLATDTATAQYFTADAQKYGAAKTLSEYELPNTTKGTVGGTDNSWKVSKVSVTTGYKPKMNFTMSKSVDTVTVKVYSDTTSSAKLVYSKDIAVNGTDFTLTDIPAKYLIGNIEISVSGSDKTFTYGFGRYAKARQTQPDGDIFKWMMNYSYYLSVAFPG